MDGQFNKHSIHDGISGEPVMVPVSQPMQTNQ